MKSNNIFIDVGPHKTASTFRQRILYPELPVKHHTLENNKDHLDLLLFSDYDDNEKHIVSCENFSGYSYYPNRNALKERFLAVENLSRMFPDARAIIVKRDKEDWIKSLYKQYVWAGGILDYDSWMNQMDERVFDIDNYIDLLNEKFSDVLILPYDLLKKNHEEFSKKICEYIDVDLPKYENRKLNVSLSDRQLRIYRFLNRFWKTHENSYGLPFFRHWREFLYRITVKDKTKRK
jgi:hypothetical protein